MKKIFQLILLSLFVCLFANAQTPTKLEVIRVKFKEDRLDLSMPALLYKPANYNPSSKYPIFIFCHGNGEGYGTPENPNNDGRMLYKIFNNSSAGGPMYWIENTSWPDSFRVGGVGDYTKMFFLAIQAPSWSLNPQQTDVAIKYLLQTYPFIDKDRIYVSGLSAGGETVVNWAARTISNSSPYTEWSPLYNKVAAMIPMSQANSYAQIKAQRAVDDSIRAWGFGSVPADQAGGQTQSLMTQMNTLKAGFGRFTNYSGGHCCWGQFYDPTYKETINGQSMNIYEWATQFSRSVPTTPTIKIPNDQATQSITLPNNTATVSNATYTIGSGTLVSIGWAKKSGPSSGYTIVSPSSVNTDFTFTTPGSYVFTLTITSTTSSGTADVAITVNDPLPSASINSPSITLPTNSVTLNSTASSNYNFTREISPLKKAGTSTKLVLINGASTSTGAGLSDPTNQSYANRIKNFWATYNIATVINKSVGGSDIFDVDITADLNTGCNIWFGNFPSNAFTLADGYSITQICQQFQKIKDSCDARGVLFFITGTQPRGDFGAPDQARLKVINDSLKLRFPNNIIDVWTAVADGTNNYKYEYRIDNDPIHGNAAMHSRMFELLVAKNMTRSFATGMGTITSPSLASTTVTGLPSAGTYYYQAAIVDERGYAAYAISTVTVNNASAIPPTVSAGSNQTIELPTNSVTLTGTATPAAGTTITGYLWEYISGPSIYTIATPSSISTSVSSLKQGTYTFRLTAFASNGLSASSTVQVIVNADPSPPTSPYIVNVGVTEYGTTWLYYFPSTDSIKAMIYWFNTSNNKVELGPIGLGGKNALEATGSFNVPFSSGNILRILDEDGYAWITRRNPVNVADRVDTDTTGAAFNGNIHIYATMSTWMTLKSDGSLWYAGNDDYNLYPGTNAISKPIKFSQDGVVYTKVAMGGRRILALTDAGAVHEWVIGGSLTPTVRTFPRPVVDIFASYYDIYIAVVPDATGSQTMGYPYVWGNDYQYWGGNAAVTSPTSIKSLWQMTVPIKAINGNQNTIGYIDSLGRLFTIGDNVQGELGIGSEWVNHMELNPNPYNWGWEKGRAWSGAPPKQVLPESGIKWKALFNSNTYNFYWWAIDSSNNAYFWGRRKSFVGGDGIQTNAESTYPNGRDVLVPTLTKPIENTPAITVPFTLPTLNAGRDTTINKNTYTVSAVGTPAAGYTISKWLWSWKQNPGDAVIENVAAQTTQITGLTPGVYVLTVQMTDNNTGTISDDITIIVTEDSPNLPPISNPGTNQTIIGQVPPFNTVLNGSASSDPDGYISYVSWVKKSGPNATISSSTALTTTVSLSAYGVYIFTLRVTDNDGASSEKDVTITYSATTPPTLKDVPGFRVGR